jgi:hypothetical protein
MTVIAIIHQEITVVNVGVCACLHIRNFEKFTIVTKMCKKATASEDIPCCSPLFLKQNTHITNFTQALLLAPFGLWNEIPIEVF